MKKLVSSKLLNIENLSNFNHIVDILIGTYLNIETCLNLVLATILNNSQGIAGFYTMIRSRYTRLRTSFSG